MKTPVLPARNRSLLLDQIANILARPYDPQQTRSARLPAPPKTNAATRIVPTLGRAIVSALHERGMGEPDPTAAEAAGMAYPLPGLADDIPRGDQHLPEADPTLDFTYGIIFWTVFSVYATSICMCIFLCVQTIRDSAVRRRRMGIGRVRDDATKPGSFTGPAIIALCCALYFLNRQLRFSYQTWLDGAEIQGNNLFSDMPGALASESEFIWSLNWGRWLQQNHPLIELITLHRERKIGNWWSAQVWQSMTPWTLFVAIEGSWRKIPHMWAYLWLAFSFSLPFAQALFFEAMLGRPVTSSTTEVLFRKDTMIADFRAADRPENDKPTNSHRKPDSIRAPQRTGSTAHRSCRDYVGHMFIEVWPTYIMGTFYWKFPIGLGSHRTVSMVSQFHQLFSLMYAPMILWQPGFKVSARSTFGWAVKYHGVSYWAMILIASTRPGRSLPSMVVECLQSVQDHPAVKRMALEFILSAFVMGTWAFRRGMVARRGLICLTGARPDLRALAPNANEDENVVLKSTDGTHKGRPENAIAAVLTWMLVLSIGLAASTTAVLGAEILWIY